MFRFSFKNLRLVFYFFSNGFAEKRGGGVVQASRREAQALEVYNLCNLRLGNELGNLLENRKSRRLDQYSSTKGFYSSRSN